MEAIVFYLLATMTAVSALLVVSLRNLFHSALALALCFFGVAGLYITLNADFVAATQILIYVGAVVTLSIFAIMLTAKIFNKEISQTNEQVLPTALTAGSLFLLLSATLLKTPWGEGIGQVAAPTTALLGQLLLGRFLLPFEVISVLLLAALIGAIVIAREDHA